MTALAFVVYFDFFNPNIRYSEYYHRHEFYHYYLGSKYSKEVGYDRLYECTTDRRDRARTRRITSRKREIRDLRVNLIKPIEATYIVKRSRPVQEALHARALGGVQEGRRLVLQLRGRQLLGGHAEGPRLQPAAGLDHDRQVLRELRDRRATASSRPSSLHRRLLPPRHRLAVRLGVRLARHGRRYRVLGLQRARELLLDGRRVPAPGLDLLPGRRAVPAPRSGSSCWPAPPSPGRRLLRIFPRHLHRRLGDHHRSPSSSSGDRHATSWRTSKPNGA